MNENKTVGCTVRAKRSLLILTLAFCIAISAIAQQLTVSGIVKNNQGEPLIGVSIAVQGKTTGTITDFDGKYSISVDRNATLVFTYVGHISQSIAVSQNILNVTLAEDAQLIDEVVVVGYGNQKKANLTGAVSSVDVGKSLTSRPIADVSRGLQGTTPGLSVVIGNGEVGSETVMKIRGQIGSIYGGSAPLILLDNVEIPSIQLVNPNDIESISILKDAASASIYGSKAAFGVILITSKKGSKREATSVQYSSNFSWQNVAKDINMGKLDGLEYSVLAAERVSSTVTGAFWLIDRASFDKSKLWIENYGNTVKNDDPMLYGRDWYFDVPNNRKMGVRMYNAYEAMVREWAPTQNHNIAVSGGSEKTSFNIGLDYLNQSGMLKHAKKDNFTKYNASVRVSTEINKYLTVRSGLIFSNRLKTYPYVTTAADPWLFLYRWSSVQPLTSEGGEDLRSPVSEVKAANNGKQEWSYNNVNIGATINLSKDWNVEADFTFANQEFSWLRPGTRFTARNSWTSPTRLLDHAGQQVFVNEKGEIVGATDAGAMVAYRHISETYTGVSATPDHIYRSSENWKKRTGNIYTTYNKILGNHNIKLMAGLNLVTDDWQSHWAQKGALMVFDNPQFDLATGTQTAGGDAGWSSQLGYFGRLNYGFKDRYLFEANLRYDGSNKFPTNLKWRYFP